MSQGQPHVGADTRKATEKPKHSFEFQQHEDSGTDFTPIVGTFSCFVENKHFLPLCICFTDTQCNQVALYTPWKHYPKALP